MPAPGQAARAAVRRDAPAIGGAARAAMAAAPAVVALLRGRKGRALLSALGSTSAEGLPAQLLRAAPVTRHPMAPAALRIERSHARGDARADQVAVTVWFGEGPALPVPGGRPGTGRAALRVGASLLGAAAVAAATAAATRMAESERPQIVEGTAVPATPEGRRGAPAVGASGPAESPLVWPRGAAARERPGAWRA